MSILPKEMRPLTDEELDQVAKEAKHRWNAEGGLLNPKLFNDRILETAKRVGFERTNACCPNVVAKMCGNDEWKGDLGGLVRAFIKEHFPEVYHEQPPA